MQTFVAGKSLTGISLPDLAAAQQLANAQASLMSASGTPSAICEAPFLPDTGLCTCLFEAQVAQAVVALDRNAGVPFSRVLLPMDLAP